MGNKLKVGVLGVGSWASICLRSIRQIPDLELVACYARTAEKRDEFAREAGCQAVESEEALLGFPGLEAVLILTPNAFHHDQVLRAARHGLHIFVEKPMANSVAECRAMIEATQRAGVALFLGHNSRRELRFRRIKALVEAGDIGQPVMAEINYTSEAGLGKRLGGWRYDPQQTPAVALSQIGIHAIDILHYLLGQTIDVQAWIRNVGMEDGLEDVCLARLLMPGGVSAMFLNAYSVPRIRSVTLMGTGANLYSDVETCIQMQARGSIQRTAIEVAQNDTVREEFEEFVACCRGERAPETDGAAGLAAVAVMHAMLHSSRNNSLITPVNQD
jgi:predicted dehydrogenase